MTLEHLWEMLQGVEDGRIKAKEAMETITLNVPSFNGGYAVLADVRAMKRNRDNLDQGDAYTAGVIDGYNQAIDEMLKKISEHFS